MQELGAFDACTNTEALMQLAKSVKQKSFVGFHTAQKTVSTQKDTDISRSEHGLFVGSLDPLSVC